MKFKNEIGYLIVSCAIFISLIVFAWNVPWNISNTPSLLLLVFLTTLPILYLYYAWTAIIGLPKGDQQAETANSTKTPDDSLICRFWGGVLGNQEAAIVIDPTHSKLLFVRCLVPFKILAVPMPSIRVLGNDVLYVQEYVYKGYHELIITTKFGRARIPYKASNFEKLLSMMKTRYQNKRATSEIVASYSMVLGGLMGIGAGTLATPASDNGFWLTINLIVGALLGVSLLSCLATVFSWPQLRLPISESDDSFDHPND